MIFPFNVPPRSGGGFPLIYAIQGKGGWITVGLIWLSIEPCIPASTKVWSTPFAQHQPKT
jgi:hypothetical protein